MEDSPMNIEKTQNFESRSCVIFFRLFLFVLFTIAILINSYKITYADKNTKLPTEIVFKLYRDYAWEAIMAGHSSDALLFEQEQGVLEQYFDEKLTSLILKDRACAKKEGICNLDFSPIWASQDPSAADLTITETNEQNIILVKFYRPGNDEKIELKYHVTKTTKGWKISDIVGRGKNGKSWSLVSILSRPEP